MARDFRPAAGGHVLHEMLIALLLVCASVLVRRDGPLLPRRALHTAPGRLLAARPARAVAQMQARPSPELVPPSPDIGVQFPAV